MIPHSNSKDEKDKKDSRHAFNRTRQINELQKRISHDSDYNFRRLAKKNADDSPGRLKRF